jgi:hypothetical protein
MLAQEDGNCTYLNQRDARNLLVVSVSQISEKQLLYNPRHFQTTAKMQYFQNASFGLTVRFWGEHRGFLEEGVKTYRMAPMSPLNSPTFFVCTSVVYDYSRNKKLKTAVV